MKPASRFFQLIQRAWTVLVTPQRYGRRSRGHDDADADAGTDENENEDGM
jgi:hypothetical protein